MSRANKAVVVGVVILTWGMIALTAPPSWGEGWFVYTFAGVVAAAAFILTAAEILPPLLSPMLRAAGLVESAPRTADSIARIFARRRVYAIGLGVLPSLAGLALVLADPSPLLLDVGIAVFFAGIVFTLAVLRCPACGASQMNGGRYGFFRASYWNPRACRRCGVSLR